MIHLQRETTKLKKLILAKADTKIIAESAGNVFIACENLIKEHGNQKEVMPLIESIRGSLNLIRMAALGRMGLGNSGEYSYELGIKDVNSIEKKIASIATILRIELEEITS